LNDFNSLNDSNDYGMLALSAKVEALLQGNSTNNSTRGFTLKAILTGVVGVIIICAVEPYNAYYVGGTHLVGNHFPIASVFLILIHAALKSLKPSYGFTTAELIVIWCMLIVVASIPYSGLVRYLFPLIPAPMYFATPENEWEELLLPHLNDWVILKDKLAVEDFYRGEQSVVPWEAWLKPLIAWSAFVVVMYFVMMCICVILRKQWVERERFSFPLVQIPGEIAQRAVSPDLLRDFFSNRLLWLGAAIPIVLHSINALHLYFPAVPNIPLTRTFWGTFPNKPWVPLNSVRLSVYFSVVGFTYLIPMEISFSMWFFFLFYKMQSVMLSAFGSPIGESTFAHRQGMGAYLVITVYIFWISKEHIGNLLRRAFATRGKMDDSNEPLKYRWAVLGLVLGIGIMTAMCSAVGMSLWVSICILLIFFSVATVLTWMVSNSGLLFVQQTFLPSEYLQTVLGSSSINPSSWAILGFQEGLMWDLREIMMPHFMNSFRISDYGDLRRRKLVLAITIAILVGMSASYYSYLKMTYHYGGLNSVAYQSFIARPKLFFGASATAISNPADTDWQESSVVLGGMVFMTFLLLMRYRFIWWPLHPVGYIMHLSWATKCLWASFLIGWLLKYFILRFGGVGAFRRFRPIFLGAVLGESIIGCIWAIIGMITKTAYSILPS
jgi:hypothetical protein